MFFPDGIRFEGNKLGGTGITLPVFNYLNPISDEKKELVDLIAPSWKPVGAWLASFGRLRAA